MITLKDIAMEANVSIMTVSNVINGKHNKVSAQTLSRVNELIEKYHFIPNQTARNLVGNSSHIIGLIVPYVDSTISVAHNPYNSELIGALERLLRQENYYLMLRSVKSLQEASTILRSWNVDGAIFLGSFDETMMESLHFHSIPMIFLDNYTPHEQVINVGLNDYAGEYEATSHLIALGHKHIAFVSPEFDESVVSVFERRFRGYKDALLNAGIPYRKEYVYTCPILYDAGIELCNRILQETPNITAICTAADMIAIGILEGARRLHVQIPRDLSLIGFDNLPATELVFPKLTSVQQDVTQKATIATKLLLQQIQQKYIKPTNITLDLTLSIKDSVSNPRCYPLFQ